MRTLTLLTSALFVAATVAACGSGGDGTQPGPVDGGAAQGAFPVTIEHTYGSTEITEEPERVVTVGLKEQDALLALGVVPVGTTEWFSEHPGAIFPWAQEELGDAEVPEVLDATDGIQFERVAALEPDLIVALYSALTEEEYETLSKIAPTIAQPAEYGAYGIPWQEETLTVGRAIGKAEEAEQLVADVESQIADVRAQHPEFEGQSAVMATIFEGFYFYGPEDARGRLLTSLGFTFPSELEEFIGADEFGGNVSEERLDLLDTDAVVWVGDDETQNFLNSHPLYSTFRVNQEGRDIVVRAGGPLYDATSFITPLSLPYLLEELEPRLVAALDGDPSTPTD